MGFLLFLIVRGVTDARTQVSQQALAASNEDRAAQPLAETIKQILKENPALAFTFWFNTGLAAVSILGLAVDHRIITGMPAWMKPLKFGISTGVYAITLAWLLTYISGRERFRSAASWVSATMLTYEVAVIAMQAARGTTSHFNHTTLFDTVLFATMGIGILIVTGIQAAIVVMLIRQPLEDKPLALALRLGAAITLLGMLVAIPMVIPHPEQLSQFQAGHGMPIAGAHTMGAADGGPGMPVTGWSTRYGDLRIAHFWGLHALQVLPLLGLLLSRKNGRLSTAGKTRIVAAAGAAYTAFMVILFCQGILGESVEHPNTITIFIGVLTLIASITAITAILLRDLRQRTLVKSA